MLVERFDRFTLRKARRTPEGHLICDAVVARAGVYHYPWGDEFRDPTEVFDPASMNSLRGVPLTVGHVRGVQVAPGDRVVGHVGQNVRRDGDRLLVADVTITDPATVAKVERRELVELSAGYSLEIDNTPGVSPCGMRYDQRQTRIRYGHVALLPEGGARCGAACSLRLDGARSQSEAARRRMVTRHADLWKQPLTATKE